MAIHYSDLVPGKSKIELKGKSYVLRPFNLLAQAWAYSEFSTKECEDGLTVLSNRLQDIQDFEASIRTVHFLLEDKKSFPTYEDFFKAIEEDTDGNMYKKIIEIYNALVDTIGISQPKMEEIQNEIDLKKSEAARVLQAVGA